MKCKNCNKEFKPIRKAQKFCSQVCAGRHICKTLSVIRKTGLYKNCINCKKIFYVPNRLLTKRKFCSKKCMCKNLSKTNLFKRNGIYKKCETCGNDFYVIKSRTIKGKYCSDKCKNNRKVIYIDGICIVCSKIFKHRNIGATQKYCSKRCGRIARKFLSRKDRRIENHSLIKFISKCERCNYCEHLEILGVHHKDKNPHNNKKNNLVVLCPNCHSIEHRVHAMNGTGRPSLALTA